MLESQGLLPYTEKYKNGWRVRIGNFKSYKDAKIAAKKISENVMSTRSFRRKIKICFRGYSCSYKQRRRLQHQNGAVRALQGRFESTI